MSDQDKDCLSRQCNRSSWAEIWMSLQPWHCHMFESIVSESNSPHSKWRKKWHCEIKVQHKCRCIICEVWVILRDWLMTDGLLSDVYMDDVESDVIIHTWRHLSRPGLRIKHQDFYIVFIRFSWLCIEGCWIQQPLLEIHSLACQLNRGCSTFHHPHFHPKTYSDKRTPM